ncbi:unnamed protein product [Staurois parvus]|uniref:Uncharacterized protein n=1 Tax=Staurois parvus TaxID=386267 RepID=A0ABN9CJS4_9NEOB|nr:unnamed protein product [Staurois parvus]
MRTRGRVPLVLMARHPHWKSQPHWEPRFPFGLRFQKKRMNFYPCVSRGTGVHSNEWALEPVQNTACTVAYM